MPDFAQKFVSYHVYSCLEVINKIRTFWSGIMHHRWYFFQAMSFLVWKVLCGTCACLKLSGTWRLIFSLQYFEGYEKKERRVYGTWPMKWNTSTVRFQSGYHMTCFRKFYWWTIKYRLIRILNYLHLTWHTTGTYKDTSEVDFQIFF